MCTQQKIVQIEQPEDIIDTWKLPIQMQQAFLKGKNPRMFVKCGKCYECNTERARNWTYKIWLESLSHKDKCFITLTYRDDKNGTQQLDKKELQNFIKRLRYENPKNNIKYYAAGEYGEKKGRAHYHAIILGWKPNDLRKWRKSKRGHQMYRSNYLNKLWGLGITVIQNFGIGEIGYLTLYLNHNNYIDRKINNKDLKKKKQLMQNLQIKHGILETYNNRQTKKITLIRKRYIKDLSKEEYKEYKKDYNEMMKDIKMTKEPEFNIYSKGMGFENYIDKEYYKYDLILDKKKYERPKEFLRKIWDNKEIYNDEIRLETINEYMKRAKFVEENYIEIPSPTQLEDIRLQRSMNKANEEYYKGDKTKYDEIIVNKYNRAIEDEMQKQESKKAQNFNRKKLYKKHESIF